MNSFFRVRISIMFNSKRLFRSLSIVIGCTSCLMNANSTDLTRPYDRYILPMYHEGRGAQIFAYGEKGFSARGFN